VWREWSNGGAFVDAAKGWAEHLIYSVRARCKLHAARWHLENVCSAVWRREGDRLILVAHHGAIPQTGSESFLPLVRGMVSGRSVLDGRTVHIADIQTEGDKFPNRASTRGVRATALSSASP
jgi:hypothetical protein